MIIIKSTVSVGFTESLRIKLNFNKIIFSLKFLRECKALWDNLYTSRIVVETDKNDVTLMTLAMKFAELLTEDKDEYMINYSLLKNGSTQK